MRVAKDRPGSVEQPLKHRGALRIEVALVRGDDAVVLSILDDGQGLNGSNGGAPGTGQGLGTMQYRPEDIGADLILEPGPGNRGLRVTCRLPVDSHE